MSRPIVVLHGALGDARQMSPLADALRATTGRDVITFGFEGMAALLVAHAYPSRVERVMTHATKLHWTSEIAARETRTLDPRAIEAKVPRFAESLRERHLGAGWERVLERTAEMMRALGERADLTDEMLRAIDVPVRARLFPRGELEVLPATPHPFEKVGVPRLASSVAEFFSA